MTQYELLFVLPGTLSEADAPGVAGSVKDAVGELGAQSVTIHDAGKSRLAYPMKKIRYGYFFVCHFQAEPSLMPQLQGRLRLMDSVLRSIVRHSPGTPQPVDRLSAISDVTVREAVREREEAPATRPALFGTAAETAETAAHTMGTAESDAKTVAPAKKETKAEDIKLEEIDKKLSELLQTDIDV